MIHSDSYRYQLDTSSRKHRCPKCNKKRFVRYIDSETSQCLNDSIGRCDRESKCGYHQTPKEFFQSIRLIYNSITATEQPQQPPKVFTLPDYMMKRTLGRYRENLFIKWLSTLPGWSYEIAEQTARMYNIGTGNNKSVLNWPIFWQIDRHGKTRSGKLIKYNPETGKRIKNGYAYDWIHTILNRAEKLPDGFELIQCLFGLHLIRPDDLRPVAIVESEKTAIIASQYIPDFIWLSTGQKNGLNEQKMIPLKNRKVLLFPDKGCFEQWQDKAKEFSFISKIVVSDLLELKAPDEHDGYDIADYLIQFDLQEFRKSDESGKSEPEKKKYIKTLLNEMGYPASWDDIPEPEPGSAEYFEMIRYEFHDSDSETQRAVLLMELDPKFSHLVGLFDAVPMHTQKAMD